MNNIAYIATDKGVTAIINGETHTITSDNPSYGQVLDAITNKEDAAHIADLFRTANAVAKYSNGAISVDELSGTVAYKGEAIHNIVVDRILEFMSKRLPVEPLIAFLERLLANPSRRSITELYTFLEHKSLPLTIDGCFLAYKGVQEDYQDVHSGKFSNRVGQTHSMPRSGVDDDFRRGCSFGFHVGSLEYATNWGPRTVIVKVDPADVVSVPSDCSCQKLRTARYTVVEDYKGAINAPLVNAATPYGIFDDEDEEDDDYDGDRAAGEDRDFDDYFGRPYEGD